VRNCGLFEFFLKSPHKVHSSFSPWAVHGGITRLVNRQTGPPYRVTHCAWRYGNTRRRSLSCHRGKGLTQYLARVIDEHVNKDLRDVRRVRIATAEGNHASIRVHEKLVWG
jgi:RimJ/RimL family protein N-acetyltransferase